MAKGERPKAKVEFTFGLLPFVFSHYSFADKNPKLHLCPLNVLGI